MILKFKLFIIEGVVGMVGMVGMVCTGTSERCDRFI